MKVTLKLPRISMNMEEGTITQWRKQPGDAFKQGEILYDIETEKATLEVEAPCDGTLVEIMAPEGEVIEVGGAVCRIEQ